MQEKALLLFSIILVMIFIVLGIQMRLFEAVSIMIKCPDHNDYWLERFEEDDCQELCERLGKELSGQNPRFCHCDKMDYRRPVNFADMSQFVFC